LAYNISNVGTAAGNSKFAIGYGFGGFPGASEGAQYAQAFPQENGGQLWSGPHLIWNQGDAGIEYWFQIQNFSDNASSFGLDGGGCT
jgi:hypothetical protein